MGVAVVYYKKVLNVEALSQAPLPLTLLYIFVLFLIEKVSLL